MQFEYGQHQNEQTAWKTKIRIFITKRLKYQMNKAKFMLTNWGWTADVNFKSEVANVWKPS